MRPVRNVFQKLSRTEQRREGVVAYLWINPSPQTFVPRQSISWTKRPLNDAVFGRYYSWMKHSMDGVSNGSFIPVCPKTIIPLFLTMVKMSRILYNSGF